MKIVQALRRTALRASQMYFASAGAQGFSSSGTGVSFVVPEGKVFKGAFSMVMNCNFAAIQNVDLKVYIERNGSQFRSGGARFATIAAGTTDNYHKVDMELPAGSYVIYVNGYASATWVTANINQIIGGYLE